jgi:hypothetical protein
MRAYRGFGAALCAVLLGACASLPPEGPRDATLEARALAVLERRGLGPDALGVIDNYVRHQGQGPAAVPPTLRGILARPFAAADAEKMFHASLPGALVALAQALELPTVPQAGPAIGAREFLAPHLEALAAAQRELRAALRGEAPSPAALLEQLKSDLPRAQVAALLGAVDVERLSQAMDLFLEAITNLAQAARAAGTRLQFPTAPLRFDSPIGPVVIGTRGDDRHAAGAALILDPGGNDVYQRMPLAAGGIAVVLDLAGDDSYEGDDLAVLALSALIDLAGDDRYSATGPAQGAAFGGISLLMDAAGHDHYRAGSFAQGAAALGFGALVDLAGHDRYEIFSGGQGFGMTAGSGVLWDRAGSDLYQATGFRDLFERGGGVSFAQGSGLGVRASIGGGIGILRDDAGDDHYSAHMFAQGGSYYYGTGLLWDRGGDDRYDAIRYAQGSGTHEAVGVLRDEAGNDRYRLEFGVGQGMGLDLSVGLLLDLGGEDEYRAPRVAQGSATANGIGILAALGRRNRFALGDDPRGWGKAQWERSLPSVGLMLYDEAGASFERAGKPATPAAGHAALGGPDGGAPVDHLPAYLPTCPAAVPAPGDDRTPLAAQLSAFLPGIIMSRGEAPLFADIRRRIAADPAAALARLPRGDFGVGYALGESLRCMLAAADASERAALWDAFERHLAQPNPGFVPAILGALRPHPAPEARMQRMLKPLQASAACAVRGAAIELAGSVESARAALRDPCWRMKALAAARLEQLGAAPDASAPLPSFLAQRIRLFSSGPGTSPSR